MPQRLKLQFKFMDRSIPICHPDMFVYFRIAPYRKTKTHLTFSALGSHRHQHIITEATSLFNPRAFLVIRGHSQEEGDAAGGAAAAAMAIPLVLVVLPLGLLFLLSGLIINAVQVTSRAPGQAASSSVILLTVNFRGFVWCSDLNQFGPEDLIFINGLPRDSALL